MIPNANGGLRVGLGVEPTVSYSSEEKAKMLIGVFCISWKTPIFAEGLYEYYPWEIKQFVNDIRQINKKEN